MKYFSKTDIGLVRNENQDRVWVGALGGNDEAVALVLCDGMGGENAGSCASQMTLDLMQQRICDGFRLSTNRNFIRNLLITSVTAANSLVFDRSKNEPDKRGMGTTCVAAIVFDSRAYIINVGDSRCYHIFDESMQQVTKDHTEIRRLIEQGKITEEEGKTHPRRNCITRAVGATKDITPDYFEIDLEEGHYLLLCSDGLHSYGDDAEIAGIVVSNPAAKCCDLLIDYALANGGRDNVTVALLQC
ncbi:MAG: Stp1/IreP family PP2C-type Ser/Thr phosphatase [Firmicutes bacterium]|nr:Stp1/IreP family PP2C-type Ser/Thr phosphatase [[Eubacterium] siraeum]MCM1489106.1 Stp1/IreP family PP2C-type Ser/Thr phosphatase [Bacillota bacterium]